MTVLDPTRDLAEQFASLDAPTLVQPARRAIENAPWVNEVERIAGEVYERAKLGLRTTPLRDAKVSFLGGVGGLPLVLYLSNAPPVETGKLVSLPPGQKPFSHRYFLDGDDKEVIAYDGFGDRRKVVLEMKYISTVFPRLQEAREELVARLGGGLVVTHEHERIFERRGYELINGVSTRLKPYGVKFDHRSRYKEIPPRR